MYSAINVQYSYGKTRFHLWILTVNVLTDNETWNRCAHVFNLKNLFLLLASNCSFCYNNFRLCWVRRLCFFYTNWEHLNCSNGNLSNNKWHIVFSHFLLEPAMKWLEAVNGVLFAIFFEAMKPLQNSNRLIYACSNFFHYFFYDNVHIKQS